MPQQSTLRPLKLDQRSSMSLSLMEAVQAQRSAAVPGSQELNEYSEKLNEAVQAQRRAVPGSQELNASVPHAQS